MRIDGNISLLLGLLESDPLRFLRNHEHHLPADKQEYNFRFRRPITPFVVSLKDIFISVLANFI